MEFQTLGKSMLTLVFIALLSVSARAEISAGVDRVWANDFAGAVVNPSDLANQNQNATSADCKSFMSTLLKKKNFSCNLVGRYQTTNINQKNVASTLLVRRGAFWKVGQAYGTETSYSIDFASEYEVALFKLNIAPVSAQPDNAIQTQITSATCSESAVRVSLRKRSPGGAWGATETTALKWNGSIMSGDITQKDLVLKLSCR